MKKPQPAKTFTSCQLRQLIDTDSIKQQSDLIGQLEDRVTYIVKLMWYYTNASAEADCWWAWDYYGHDEQCPSFEVDRNIVANGEYIELFMTPEVDYIYDKVEYVSAWIPTQWLSGENVDAIIKKAIQDDKDAKNKKKQEQKARRQQLKSIKQELTKSAKSKLTAEEKWAIGLSKKMPKHLNLLAC